MNENPGRIGRYSIDAEIGRGGMGIVYLGTDTRLARHVAIKAMHERVELDSELSARLEREAKTLAALNHPNIASLYDVEVHEERLHLVMEFVDGESLAQHLTRGPMRVDRALELGTQIAEGLAAAHEAGFVHRDLKPSNVQVTPDGLAKILDFGLARLEAKPGPVSPGRETTELLRSCETTPGAIMGTVSYMSPEQSRGEAVDRRTDIWAFGILLYQMLTGANPFARDTAAECLAATLSESVDFDCLPSSTPHEVAALIRRCLARDRRHRQRDAGDCALILREARSAQTDASIAPTRRPAVADRALPIDDQICRTLDREGFDSLLPGWRMRYADNDRDSDVLIVWVPSIGGDHTTTQWRELIAASPHRMVIVTPVGMEPGVEARPVVSLENQLALIRALVRHLQTIIRPRRTIISGFSCGSIMALRCAAGSDSEELFDGVLAIEADLQESDCFITRLFASLDASSAHDVMQGLFELGTSCATISEWLTLHQHLVECVHKMQNDFSPLVRQGRDLSCDYEGVRRGQDSPFVGYLRDALARVGIVRCAFNEGAENRRVLGEIRMLHLDDSVLGPRFTDEVIEFVPVGDHEGMMRNERLLGFVARMVDTVGDSRVGR